MIEISGKIKIVCIPYLKIRSYEVTLYSLSFTLEFFYPSGTNSLWKRDDFHVSGWVEARAQVLPDRARVMGIGLSQDGIFRRVNLTATNISIWIVVVQLSCVCSRYNFLVNGSQGFGNCALWQTTSHIKAPKS